VSDINNKPNSAKNLLNWTESLLNCKDPNFKEYNATVCEPNKDTTDTRMWTNIFRVEIAAQVDYGNLFCFNKQIYLFSRITNIE